jgi:hypothetical protein
VNLDKALIQEAIRLAEQEYHSVREEVCAYTSRYMLLKDFSDDIDINGLKLRFETSEKILRSFVVNKRLNNPRTFHQIKAMIMED